MKFEVQYFLGTNSRHSFLRIFGIILGFSLIFPLQFQIDNIKNNQQRIEELTTLPKGEYLKPFLLGYQQLAADLIWLRVIQVNGDKIVSEKGYDWIYHALDVVTTLDPKFAYAYQFGGVNLGAVGKKFEKSNALLMKGLRETPDVWQIPFYLGFNYFFYLNDFQTAADYMAKASLLPGHPAYLPQLTSRLYAQAGRKEAAVQFLEQMIQQTEDDKVKEALQERVKQIQRGEVTGIFGDAGRK